MRNRVGLVLLLVCLGVHAQDLPPDLVRATTEYEASTAAPLLDRAYLFPDGMVRTASLSPDGHFVAAGVRDGKTLRLMLLDTVTLEERLLFANDRIRNIEWSKNSQRLFVELTDSVGVVVPEDPAHASYLTRLDRLAGDVYLGLSGYHGEHVLVARKRNGIFALARVALDGTERQLLESTDQIDQALEGSSPDDLYLVLHDTSGQRVMHFRNGVSETIYECGLPRLNACELLAYDNTGGILWLKLHGDRDKAGL